MSNETIAQVAEVLVVPYNSPDVFSMSQLDGVPEIEVGEANYFT
jgi:hypothetical protein